MSRETSYYREQAAHFRELAGVSDDTTAAALLELAEEFEAEALRLDPGDEADPASD